MEKLTQKVKDGGLKKWNVKFTRRKVAGEWLEETAFQLCSFCYYYEYDSRGCICILHGDDDYTCCKEVADVEGLATYSDGYRLKSTTTLKDFNLACRAVYDRIASLKVGK